MKNVARWVIARGREPSTYAGLAALLLAFNVPYADSWAHVISTLAIGFFGEGFTHGINYTALFLSE